MKYGIRYNVASRKRCLTIGCVICPVATITALALWGIGKYRTAKQLHDQQVQAQLLAHIATLDHAKFDFVLTAKQFDLAYDELRDHLFALERSHKIKCTPRYLARKPIILSVNDMVWYFDRPSMITKDGAKKSCLTHMENENPPHPAMRPPPAQTPIHS